MRQLYNLFQIFPLSLTRSHSLSLSLQCKHYEALKSLEISLISLTFQSKCVNSSEVRGRRVYFYSLWGWYGRTSAEMQNLVCKKMSFAPSKTATNTNLNPFKDCLSQDTERQAPPSSSGAHNSYSNSNPPSTLQGHL